MGNIMTQVNVSRPANAFLEWHPAHPLLHWGNYKQDNKSYTTDNWMRIRAQDQSGLEYFWCDSAPLLPATTKSRLLQLRLKRALDITAVTMIVIMLAPVLILIAVLIKLSSKGPILFTQSRTGHNNAPFDIYKFRSMFESHCDRSGVLQTVAGDRRVTRIGKILRRTNIDELPQLINILKGEMSLVGPRPHVPGQLANERPYHDLVPYYSMRHSMRPGLTGWAQCNGLRGPTTDPILAKGRIDHDMAYIQNFSVLLDIKIMILTVWREFTAAKGF